MYKAPPICFDKVKEIFMPIFRKRIDRGSSVVVAIEADNMTKADNIFEEWLKDPNNSEEFNCALSEKEKDSEGYLASFDNWDALNRARVSAPDFQIKETQKEPLFDLIIKYPTMDDYKERWEGIPMCLLLHLLGNANDSYILEPEHYTTGGSLVNMTARIDAGISGIAVFKATRREDK